MPLQRRYARVVCNRAAGAARKQDRRTDMGSIDREAFAKRARPILWTRDYEAAKSVLVRVGRDSEGDERFLSLLRAVYDYERNPPAVELSRIVELAECVFVPGLPGDESRSRRWSDTAV
jgi:hypothetical protein